MKIENKNIDKEFEDFIIHDIRDDEAYKKSKRIRTNYLSKHTKQYTEDEKILKMEELEKCYLESKKTSKKIQLEWHFDKHNKVSWLTFDDIFEKKYLNSTFNINEAMLEISNKVKMITQYAGEIETEEELEVYKRNFDIFEVRAFKKDTDRMYEADGMLFPDKETFFKYIDFLEENHIVKKGDDK